jgi:hypothetical protein
MNQFAAEQQSILKVSQEIAVKQDRLLIVFALLKENMDHFSDNTQLNEELFVQ